MKSALICGKNGNIGGALFKHLTAKNIETFGTTNRVPSDKHTIHLNLADDPSSWNLSEHPVEVAYLCSGICRMNLCEQDPTGTHKVNVAGMTALIKQLSDKGAFIVYLSTNQVFDGLEPFAKENKPHKPKNEYGKQKAAVERFIQENCSRYAIVRLTKVVEPNMALIKNWIDLLSERQPLKAFHDMPLAPVSLRQVIETLTLIGEKQVTGIYHISGSEDVSYFTIASFLAQKLKSSRYLVQSISALDANIEKNFLPQFTSLDCSSTIALGGQTPPDFTTVLEECFTFELEEIS